MLRSTRVWYVAHVCVDNYSIVHVYIQRNNRGVGTDIAISSDFFVFVMLFPKPLDRILWGNITMCDLTKIAQKENVYSKQQTLLYK